MLIHDTALDPGSAYERQFAGQIGAAHAIAFGHARTALRAILSALGLSPGDRVVLSPLTCKVVPLTLFSLNLTPVYADISPRTLNLDPERLSAALAGGARAALFQHTYGIPSGAAEAARIARERGVPLIEDRAQTLPHAPDPLLGAAAIYSNNLLKPLPAGSGGVAVTNDESLADALRRASCALPRPTALASARLLVEAWTQRRLLRPESYWQAMKMYSRISAGYRERPVAEETQSDVTSLGVRPSNRQMREGTRWLSRAGAWARQRLECCEEYGRALHGCASLSLPAEDQRQPLYYFPVRARRKTAILAEAARRRVELIAWPRSTPIYPIESVSQLRAYGFEPASCPEATAAAGELIGLPTHDRMTAPRRQKVIDLLRSFS